MKSIAHDSTPAQQKVYDLLHDCIAADAIARDLDAPKSDRTIFARAMQELREDAALNKLADVINPSHDGTTHPMKPVGCAFFYEIDPAREPGPTIRLVTPAESARPVGYVPLIHRRREDLTPEQREAMDDLQVQCETDHGGYTPAA